ncbi:precorrin-6A/cobalt-precorrin-6A reductase, partial [Streptomyces mirabilis]
MSPHVLVLGGTTEARRLAAELAARPGVRVTTSLAGRVARPGALD